MTDDKTCTKTSKINTFRTFIWLGGGIWTYNSGFGIVKAIFWPMWFGARLAEFALNI